MRKVIFMLITATVGLLAMTGSAHANNSVNHTGCHHGKSNKPCRPDPQPTHGHDCDNRSGGNQDHCLPASNPPNPNPSPSVSASVQGVTLTRPTVGGLAKTGSKETGMFAGVALILFGMGLLLRTFDRKHAPQL